MNLLSKIAAIAFGVLPTTGSCSPAPAHHQEAESFTASQERRLAAITGRGIATQDPRGGMWAAMSGISNGLSASDVKLLKEDRRRAAAAYPGVSQDELFEARWFGFHPMSVLEGDVGASNSEGTQGRDGKWYVDSAYLSVVKAQYPRRASHSEAVAYLAAKKVKDRAATLARLEAEGTFSSWGGSGGSGSYTCNKKAGCVVEFAAEWSSEATRYTFPFVPEEWVDFWPYSAKDLAKLSSFKEAKVEKIAVKPSGVTVTMGNGTYQGPKGMTVPPGGTFTLGMEANVPRTSQ